MQSQQKNHTKVCKRKRNIVGDLKLLVSQFHDVKGCSKRSKNADLLFNSLLTIDDPRVKEMIDKYKDINRGNNADGKNLEIIKLLGSDGLDGSKG